MSTCAKQLSRWSVVIIPGPYLLCLAWLRISSGKCLAAIVMMLRWKWVEVHSLTALWCEEQNDPIFSATHTQVGMHTCNSTHRVRSQLHEWCHMCATSQNMQHTCGFNMHTSLKVLLTSLISGVNFYCLQLAPSITSVNSSSDYTCFSCFVFLTQGTNSFFSHKTLHFVQTFDKMTWIIIHFTLVLRSLACLSHDPWRSTISVTHTHIAHTLVSQRPCSPIVSRHSSHDPERHAAGVCSYL